MDARTLLRPSRKQVHVLGLLLALAASLPGHAAPSAAKSGSAVAGVAVTQAGFDATVAGLWPEAERSGVSRVLFDATFAGLTPDSSLVALTRQQPEFAKPIGAYLAAQVTAARVATGQSLLVRWDTTLTAVESRYGVPAAVVVAVWGLETNFGAAPGSKDVIRSMATLAALNVRPALYRAELVAALALLQAGEVQRDALRGSWAGAMGQPQFMPSSYAKFAVDGDGDGRRDIWTSVPDTLASIANFLRQQGWQPGQPWGFPVRLPAGADPGRSRGSFAAWSARGFVRVDGKPMPTEGEGILLFPAGATGPGFLVTTNFEVLKTYNFSDAYVLSVGLLADRMTDGPGFPGFWPSAPSLARDDRIALQARLAALGYPVDNREGRISLALRDVIRKAQARVGQVADGNATAALLAALRGVQNGN